MYKAFSSYSVTITVADKIFVTHTAKKVFLMHSASRPSLRPILAKRFVRNKIPQGFIFRNFPTEKTEKKANFFSFELLRTQN